MSNEPVIAAAAQRGGHVYVYDDRGHTITTLPGELISFTGSTVTVQRGNHYYIYNAKGSSTRVIPAGK